MRYCDHHICYVHGLKTLSYKKLDEMDNSRTDVPIFKYVLISNLLENVCSKSPLDDHLDTETDEEAQNELCMNFVVVA